MTSLFNPWDLYLGTISNRIACLIPKELANGREASFECALTTNRLRTAQNIRHVRRMCDECATRGIWRCLEMSDRFNFFRIFPNLSESFWIPPGITRNAFFLRCFNSSWTSARLQQPATVSGGDPLPNSAKDNQETKMKRSHRLQQTNINQQQKSTKISDMTLPALDDGSFSKITFVSCAGEIFLTSSVWQPSWVRKRRAIGKVPKFSWDIIRTHRWHQKKKWNDVKDVDEKRRERLRLKMVNGNWRSLSSKFERFSWGHGKPCHKAVCL